MVEVVVVVDKMKEGRMLLLLLMSTVALIHRSHR
jgi:hypothetical protein